MKYFTVHRSIRTLLRADHVSYLEGVNLSVCQPIPCERAGKLPAEGRDLYFWGLTFVSPYGASHILDQTKNINGVIQILFPLLTIQ